MKTNRFVPLVTALAATLRLAAQTTPTTASTQDSVTKLEAVTVSDVPISQQVLPTVRPISSVLGDPMSIIDIPRSVSSVNAAWMDDRQVKNAMDFGQFAPGVYSEAQYGIPAVPFIRGDLSQIYIDGQMIPFTRNSVPPSFNGVEAMDIVKGPGSAVYGPQGEGAGGYVNFVPKTPYFDAQHYDVSVTLGDWTSGHSYGNPEATIDFGGPLSDKLAYRVSYLSRYGDGYYLGDKSRTQDLYFALAALPTKDLRIDWWVQGFHDITDEIGGANRVTQQFIWNGSYIAGPASYATSGPNAYYGNDIVTYLNPPKGTYGSKADGSYSIVNPATAHTITLPDYVTLINPDDSANATLFHTQLKEALDLTPESSLVNRTYFAYGNANKFEAYGYNAYVPVQEEIEDRLEYHGDFSTGSITHQLIAGYEFRYQRLVSYEDFSTEPFGSYDLGGPASSIVYPGYALEGNTMGGGLTIPGRPGYSAELGSSGNQFSHIYDHAGFVQDNVSWTSKLSTVLGFREDELFANTQNPSYVQIGKNSAATGYTYYPQTPYNLPAGSLFNVSATHLDPSYFGSAIFKITPTTSAYLTYDHVDAILGSANFGGVNVNANSNGGTPAGIHSALDQSMTTKSTLYEAGVKTSQLNNTLYASLSAFQQIKLGSEFTGRTFPIKDDGLEADVVYQPSKQLTLNANATYQDATAFDTGFYQQTGSYLDYYSTTTPVDGTTGTGKGGTNFTTYVPPDGRIRAPGIPQFMVNAFAEYKWTNGFGVGVGPQFIGHQYANDQGTLHIPSETEWDGYLIFRQRRWDVRINVKNLTNARLLDPIDVSFAGNDSIFVRQPISASVTFRLHL